MTGLVPRLLRRPTREQAVKLSDCDVQAVFPLSSKRATDNGDLNFKNPGSSPTTRRLLLASCSSRCLAGIPALTLRLADPQTGWCLQPPFARSHLCLSTARKLRMLPEFATDFVHLQAQKRAVELTDS